MGVEKSFVERVRRVLRHPPEVRKLTLVYDKREQPPWTCELQIDGRVLALRAGASMQEAITGVVDAERRHAERVPGALTRTLDRSPAALARRA